MTDYTPWAVESVDYKGQDLHWIVDSAGRSICDLYHLENPPNSGEALIFDNAEKHAELIASAPRTKEERDELLVALINLRRTNAYLMDAVTAHKIEIGRATTEAIVKSIKQSRELIERIES